MKKSNLLFLYLMVALYIFPFIIWGVKESTCKNQAYTGIYKEQAFIDIENPQAPGNIYRKFLYKVIRSRSEKL